MTATMTHACFLASLLVLGACASQPQGPSVLVMPAPGKPFDSFQMDQVSCEQYASSQIAGGAQQANNKQALTGVVGTVLGAGLGAAIGGGRGAAIGAGGGALGGTAFGAGPAQAAQGSLQQRYDGAYMQCMYSRGNQVPGYSVVNTAPQYGTPSYGSSSSPAYVPSGGYGRPYP